MIPRLCVRTLGTLILGTALGGAFMVGLPGCESCSFTPGAKTVTGVTPLGGTLDPSSIRVTICNSADLTVGCKSVPVCQSACAWDQPRIVPGGKELEIPVVVIAEDDGPRCAYAVRYVAIEANGCSRVVREVHVDREPARVSWTALSCG